MTGLAPDMHQQRTLHPGGTVAGPGMRSNPSNHKDAQDHAAGVTATRVTAASEPVLITSTVRPGLVLPPSPDVGSPSPNPTPEERRHRGDRSSLEWLRQGYSSQSMDSPDGVKSPESAAEDNDEELLYVRNRRK